MQKQQREFLLKEQLKVIQKELGIAKDDRTAELDKFKERLAKLKLTEQAQKRVDEEMEKMGMLETGSPEYSVTRNYLEWITLLPWGKHSKGRRALPAHRRRACGVPARCPIRAACSNRGNARHRCRFVRTDRSRAHRA